MITFARFSFFLFLIILFSGKQVVLAEDGIILSPPFQEITLSDQQTESFSFEVKNATSQPAIFEISALDFGTLNESGGVAFLGGTNELEKKYSLASWMRPSRDSLSVEPGKSETVEVVIENRDDLSPGGHYAAIVLRSPTTAAIAQGRGIAVNQIFSILTFVKKIGGERYSMELEQMELERHAWTLPAKVNLRFRNTGNIHVIPRGILSLRDPRGSEIRHGTLNAASALILPESTRVFPEGLFSVGTAFFPGTYTLLLQYRFDGNDTFSASQETFFYIPLLFLLSLLFLGFLFTCVVIWRRRKGKKSPGLSSEVS